MKSMALNGNTNIVRVGKMMCVICDKEMVKPYKMIHKLLPNKGNGLESVKEPICEECWIDIALDNCERGQCNHPTCHGEEADKE